MRKSVISTLLILLIAALPGFAKPRKSSSSRTRTSSSAGKRTGSKTSSKRRSTSGRTTRTAKGRATAKGRSTQQSRRSYQQAPTPERYREIQHALAEKGFYKGEENGVWGADSVEALKSFQREKNLNPTGKLDSVSLIALGLGPKRTTTADGSTPLLIQRPQDDNRRTEGSERP